MKERVVFLSEKVIFDYDQRMLIDHGRIIKLTKGECEFLFWLVEKKGGILTNREYATKKNEFTLEKDLTQDSRMKNYVLRLRRKCDLFKEIIISEQKGYKLLVDKKNSEYNGEEVQKVICEKIRNKTISLFNQMMVVGDGLRKELLPKIQVGEKKYSCIPEYLFQICKEKSNTHVHLIEAEGGSGKTCGLIMGVKELIYDSGTILFFIPVKELEYEYSSNPLSNWILRYYLDKKESKVENFVEYLEEFSQEVLIVVDGLDEIGLEKQQLICKEIQILAKNMRHSHVVVSSRYFEPNKTILQLYSEAKLLPFSKEQIQRIMRIVDPKGQYVFGRLALSPMMVRMIEEIGNSYGEEKEIVINHKADLLRIYYKVLMKKDHSKLWVYNYLLPLLAYESYLGNAIQISYLRELFEYVVSVGRKYEEEKERISWRFFRCIFDENIYIMPAISMLSIRTSLEQTGILEYVPQIGYRFTHKDYRDFLAAYFIVLLMKRKDGFRKHGESLLSALIEENRYYRVLKDGKIFGISSLTERAKNVEFCELLFYQLNMVVGQSDVDYESRMLVFKLGLSIANTLDDIEDAVGLYQLGGIIEKEVEWYIQENKKNGYDYRTVAGICFLYYGQIHLEIDRVFPEVKKQISARQDLLERAFRGLSFCQGVFEDILNNMDQIEESKNEECNEYIHLLAVMSYNNLGACWLGKGMHSYMWGEEKMIPAYIENAIYWHTKGGEIINVRQTNALATDFVFLAKHYIRVKETSNAIIYYHKAIEEYLDAVNVKDEKYVPYARLAICYRELEKLMPEKATEYRDAMSDAFQKSLNELRKEDRECVEIFTLVKREFLNLDRIDPTITNEEENYITEVCEICNRYRPQQKIKWDSIEQKIVLLESSE